VNVGKGVSIKGMWTLYNEIVSDGRKRDQTGCEKLLSVIFLFDVGCKARIITICRMVRLLTLAQIVIKYDSMS
jgi:hypothetical protein